MKNIEFYKHKIKSAAEEGIVEYNKKDKPKEELIQAILNKKGKYNKLVASIQLAKEIMPKSVGKTLSRKLDQKDFSELPFKPEEFELKGKIGSGYVSKVYLLNSQLKNQPSLVIKLDFCNYGDIDKLREIAWQNHKDYELVRQYYRSLPDLVPEEMSFITTSRKDKQPVIATIQHFLGNDIRGVFDDYSRQELISLLGKDDDLRNDFVNFVNITADLAEKKKLAVDLIGERNLTIVKNQEAFYLKFLDPHLISPITSNDKKRNKMLRQAIEYLKSIKEEL